MIKFNIEAPWYTFQKKVTALFANDPDIYVGDVYEPDNEDIDYAFDIEVRSHEKFVALDRVIPAKKQFGNVTLGIVLYDEENNDVHPGYELFNTIFKGNSIVKDLKTVTDRAGIDHVFVRFEPEVIQFYDDDLTDYNGNYNGLAEDIAREVFGDAWAVNFCTVDKRENEDSAGSLHVPLGEWP